jgi:predicted Rossmann-fold nucleotide-binding protein
MVFYNPDGFWEPLFTLLRHTVDMGLSPAAVMSTWRAPTTIDGILPAVAEMAAVDGPHIALEIKARV